LEDVDEIQKEREREREREQCLGALNQQNEAKYSSVSPNARRSTAYCRGSGCPKN